MVQPAVFECRHGRAIVQLTRLYDANDRIEKSGLHPEHYIALSYCWREWEDDDALKNKLAGLSERLKIRYFWVDRWCVDQEDEVDKAREIHRMGEYYMGASACLVLAGPNIEPFPCVPQQDGVVLSSFQQLLLNTKGLRSLIQCQ
ncbi:hypothetical protein F4810DRAFT_697736 [Camillea tinctor]|nr:hypothetical protein F4810DRAFT_697736 [Camillea tinctor]